MTFFLLGKDEIIKELLLQHTAFLYTTISLRSLYIYITTFTAFTARDITQLYSAGNFPSFFILYHKSILSRLWRLFNLIKSIKCHFIASVNSIR